MNNIPENIIINIDKYIEENDWKIWINYKEDIKNNSLKLEKIIYNELINYIYEKKESVVWENKLKIFELYAMLVNNKINL